MSGSVLCASYPLCSWWPSPQRAMRSSNCLLYTSGSPDGLLPAVAADGTKVMSTNLLLENDTDPVIWRGPMIAGVVKQFWSDVVWGDIDYLLVDMPPGTGDVPLTVFQSLPVDGISVVLSLIHISLNQRIDRHQR